MVDLIKQVSNLKKVLKAIVDYLSDVHGLELDSFIPDVNEIGEKQDEEQMGRLLQLVLGIAIHCDGKEGRNFMPCVAQFIHGV